MTAELDARNLLCPMPVIKLQSLIKTLHPGDEVEVFCTDPGTVHDIPAWCRVHGHEVIELDESDSAVIFFLIRVSGK